MEQIKYTLVGLLLLCCYSLLAQAPKIEIEGRSISAKNPAATDKWIFETEDDSIYLLVSFDHYKEMAKRLEQQKIELETKQAMLDEERKLLQAYIHKDTTAERFIQRQDFLLAQSTKIIKEYKVLNEQLSQSLERPKFTIVPGIGIRDITGMQPSVMGSIGVELAQISTQFQFNSNYMGVVVGYRWRVF